MGMADSSASRLLRRADDVMTTAEGESTGRRLLTQALTGGSQALQRECGAIATGKRADFIVLDGNHPDLAAAKDDVWLDAWIFVAGRSAVKDVFVDGVQVIADGVHHRHDVIEKRYRAVLSRLSATQ